MEGAFCLDGVVVVELEGADGKVAFEVDAAGGEVFGIDDEGHGVGGS